MVRRTPVTVLPLHLWQADTLPCLLVTPASHSKLCVAAAALATIRLTVPCVNSISIVPVRAPLTVHSGGVVEADLTQTAIPRNVFNIA